MTKVTCLRDLECLELIILQLLAKFNYESFEHFYLGFVMYGIY